MPKSAATIAEEISDQMRKQGAQALTYQWKDFYKATGRERIKEAFQEQLAHSLGARSLLIAYGRAAVVVCQDYNFNPVKG
ncbi:hypothetical protein FOC27_10240 [Burkholderia multivorans]|uniref:hypothetical protein n=1 Tax=Burkholderia cepacia complex TaxID=87882 RepID=UPI0012DC545C|nr:MULTISPECIES: hypothetical protein [Burkholderia cepacia complex]MBR8094714.1 hypothetical protein [Burkholderia cenocepacia]MBU9341698.1 hypothetical protein [Burkholderia multivorans]MCA8143871.1 hypothetical protein [Burkholderia multivorans]QGR60573.1 hypothetical protein FOC27_10240 [Burkholderia multivorans]